METSLPPDIPRPSQIPPPIPSRKSKAYLWVLAVVGLVVVVFAYSAYIVMQQKMTAQEDALRAAQAKAETEARPHREILAKINDFRHHSTALPACPLVYPLLDAKGRISPLGTYLSYLAMQQASFLPQSVFCMVDAGQSFSEFGLFDADSPFHQAYYKQLPYYFQNAKDLGEGKLLKSKKGWKIQLRFWGTKSEKKYTRVFRQGKLHLAVGWMASCLQDYMGFRPTAVPTARDADAFPTRRANSS